MSGGGGVPPILIAICRPILVQNRTAVEHNIYMAVRFAKLRHKSSRQGTVATARVTLMLHFDEQHRRSLRDLILTLPILPMDVTNKTVKVFLFCFSPGAPPHVTGWCTRSTPFGDA